MAAPLLPSGLAHLRQSLLILVIEKPAHCPCMLQLFFPGSIVLSLPSALSQTSHQSCCHWLCDFSQKTMAAAATGYSIRQVWVCVSTPFVALACEVSLTVCSALGFSSRKATGCLSPQMSHSSTLQNPALCSCVLSHTECDF